MAAVAAPQDLYLFNYTEGDTLPGGVGGLTATIADTNMPGAGNSLPKGHEMLVYSVQVIPDEFGNAGTATTNCHEGTPGQGVMKWEAIFHQSYLILQVEQSKSYVEGRLDAFPMGGGFLMEQSINAASVNSNYIPLNGDRTWQAIRPLATPLHLGEQENWSVKIRWPRTLMAAAAVTPMQLGFGLMVRLTGLRRRPSL